MSTFPPREWVYIAAPTSLLLVPFASMILRFVTLSGTDEQRSKLWLENAHLNYVISLIVLAIWCGFWEFPLSASRSLFWIVPACSAAITRASAQILGRAIFSRKWTLMDIFRMVLWSTACSPISMLMIAGGIHAMFKRQLLGALWFIAAGLTALVATVCLRSAQGITMRRVKTGTLFNRVMHLSRRIGIKVERVCVVPAGRGQLTNAFASPRTVALTDNFGEYLSGAELDAVIAHELGHVQGRHTIKKLQTLALAVSALAFISFSIGTARPLFRAALVAFSLIAVLLIYYYLSRRFEYMCDIKAAELTRSPEAVIRALGALYQKTSSPVTSPRLVEIFDTHPSLQHRIEAIARESGMSAAQVSRYLPCAERSVAANMNGL